jgi:hypothetical protein
MPSVALAKLQFKEKLLQSGRSGGSDALQKRLRVGSMTVLAADGSSCVDGRAL